MACKTCQTCGFGPRDFAAVCATCIWADRGAGYWEDGVIGCTIDGTPLGERLAVMKRCPKGRVSGGIVRWLSIRWYGVPLPIRLWLFLTGSRRVSPRAYAGCGCVRKLRDIYTRWTSKEAAHGVQPQPLNP